MTSANLPPAHQFIVDSLRIGPTDKAETAPMQSGDWDDLLRIAAMHRLGPILNECITRNNLSSALPVKIKDALKAAYRTHTLRNLAMYKELVTLTRILNTEQIPSIALKGAFLARFAYPALGLRPMRDLDLLIAREQVVKAFNTLKDAGYRPFYDGIPEAYLEGNKLHLSPMSSPGGFVIELHHRLTLPNPPDIRADNFEKELWKRRITRRIGAIDIAFLCPEHLLLHLCYHATVCHQFSLGPLALMDIALLLEAEPIDWEDFLGIVSVNWRRCALAPLYLAKLHLGAKVPAPVIDALDGNEDRSLWLEMAEYLLFSKPNDDILRNASVQKILCSTDKLERLRAIACMLFPSRIFIATKFPVKVDSLRVFLYYPKNWRRLLNEKLPDLMSNLLAQPRELEKQASHKLAFATWLERHTD